MILGFSSFDPLKGEPPNTFPELGGDIVYRARQLLGKRNKKEIKLAVKILNWMLEQSPAREDIWNALLADAEALDAGDAIEVTSKRNMHSQTYTLLRCMDKFDLRDYPELSEITWAELFAVLSLALINQVCDDEAYYGSWHHEELVDWQYEWRIHTHASYWLVQAMDAVATAEGLQRAASVIGVAKQKISLRNRQAAIQKHAKTNEALLALRDFYLEGKHKSMRNAAQLFCERFPHLVSHLAHYNRVRTLSEGLSKLLKDQRPSLQNLSQTIT